MPSRTPGASPRTTGSRLIAAVLVCVATQLVSACSEQDAVKTPTRLQGQATMVTADLVVVEASDGTSTLFSLNKGTVVVDPLLKPGDQVEVVLSSTDQAATIRKRAPERGERGHIPETTLPVSMSTSPCRLRGVRRRVRTSTPFACRWSRTCSRPGGPFDRAGCNGFPVAT